MKLPTAPTRKPQANSSKLLNMPSKKASPLQRSVRKITAKIKQRFPDKSSSVSVANEQRGSITSDVEPLKAGSLSTAESPAAVSSNADFARGLPFIKDSKGSRLAFNLLLVRPWVLVAGFWLVSLLSAAVAWEGMISPKRLTMELPQPEVPTTEVTEKDAFLKVEQDADAEAGTSTQVPVQAADDSSRARSANTADGSRLPVWPLGALVGTCAAGCLAISRRRAVMRMATVRSATARSHGKRRVRLDVAPQAVGQSKMGQSKMGQSKSLKQGHKQTKARQANAQKSKVTALRRPQPVADKATLRGLAKPKKRRQRRRSTATSAPTRRLTGSAAIKTTQPAVLVSRSTAQKQVPADARKIDARKPIRRVKRNSQRPGYRKQPVVSVVPASESHALDWRNGSLAHKLDVRPQRTASM